MGIMDLGFHLPWQFGPEPLTCLPWDFLFADLRGKLRVVTSVHLSRFAVRITLVTVCEAISALCIPEPDEVYKARKVALFLHASCRMKGNL